jgi:hypothetical protein
MCSTCCFAHTKTIFGFIRPESEAFRKIFNALGFGTYIQLAARPPSLEFADKTVEPYEVFPHLFSIGLNSFPYKCNLFS